MTLPKYMEARVLGPLGMTETAFEWRVTSERPAGRPWSSPSVT